MIINAFFTYRMKKLITAVSAVIILLISCPCVYSDSENTLKDKWRFSVYYGRWSKATFLDTILRQETDPRDSWITVIGANKKLLSLGRHIHLEHEYNIGKHSGKQDHIEINGLLAIRWKKFPWHKYLNTSVSFGNGPSWAFSRPAIERRDNNPDPSRFLLYMIFEIELGLPMIPYLSFFMRIHHRSGAFGLIKEKQGSNIIGGGIRSSF